MSVTGRPSKLTAAAQKSIADGVAKGLPLKHAARCAGVGESTLRAWRATGRAEASGPYQALEAAIKKADSDAVARNVATVQRAAAERDEVTVKTTAHADADRERENIMTHILVSYRGFANETEIISYTTKAHAAQELSTVNNCTSA